MKPNNLHTNKFTALFSIIGCFFIGYVNIKNGIGEEHWFLGYVMPAIGVLIILIAVIAAFGLLKRTVFKNTNTSQKE